MALVKGPFDVKWGANVVEDISEVSLDYSQDNNQYSTIDNRKYTVDGAIEASVTLTLLGNDIPALAMLLPQYHVANGAQLSSGETVTDADGAIDVKAASCDMATVYNDLDIISCGNPGQVFRLKNARSTIDGMELADNAIRTISIKFVGEPAQGVANVQFFKSGSLNPAS